jgi:RHH-type proline utilization regulon transcriptional repressor/proline dehydrogenase/delta 1-pyrroline-5-carboxylate dehydrogenase
VGSALAAHPAVAFTVFTGTSKVGFEIAEGSGGAAARARQIKPVIAAMGASNAIIIDSDADIDAAVWPVVQSAFGYMGQKCSSASRLIVLSENHDKFVEKFRNAVETLVVGPAEDARSDVGAVIDARARTALERIIAAGADEGTLLTRGPGGRGPGHFVAPAVFTDVDPASPWAREEILGPVVCLFRADDFEEALELANATPYALVGGVFSRSPANIERACQDFMAGSLYINRPITGAMMKRHPFGGFRMSGAGAKSMGQEYLQQFMHTRTIVENTFRSGFAPMETR